MTGPRTYRCYLCGKTFNKGWSDEQAMAELRENFGNVSVSECGEVCDDCYPLVMAYIKDQHPPEH